MSDNKASNPSSSCNSRGEPRVADINNEIRVELQRVLCGVLWDEVMSKGDSLSIADQEKVMEELYHGKTNEPDSISYSHLLSQGQDIFDDMFELVEGQKILQWKYHRTNKRLVLGEHITRECLEKVHKRSPRLLSGRNMLDKRKTVVPLVRKAFSFLKKYIDMTTGALLPGHSGWDAEDVENAVRKDMYYELVVRKKLVDNDDDEDNVDVKVVDHNNNKGKTVESEEVQKEDIDNNGNDDGTDGYKVPEDFVWVSLFVLMFRFF